MKLFGFVLTLVLLAFVMLAASSPPTKQARQSVAQATAVQVAEVPAYATAAVQNNYIEQIAKDDNSVVGVNTIDRKNEVAARARSGVKESQGTLTLNYQSRPTDADICKALLI